jgi:bifunctional non-homologous end joining protein LigD
MVPYVEDRPLTLVRAPSGMKGKTFYVRHAGDWAPAELRQVAIPDGTGSGSTMIADNVTGLVALAQMNVLEIHAWNARTAKIEQPDRMVFDLDPGPQVSWTAIVEGALHVRAALQLLDLESFVKTTGSKGLHVVVPLVPDAGWKETLAFTHTVALAISRAEPRRYTASIPKAGREDKILIDYLRNRRGATSISIYSARARPLASVSVPVAWEDLGPELRSDTFHVGDWTTWLRARKRDPWKRYLEVRQKLTAARLKEAAALAGRL